MVTAAIITPSRRSATLLTLTSRGAEADHGHPDHQVRQAGPLGDLHGTPYQRFAAGEQQHQSTDGQQGVHGDGFQNLIDLA